jgi:hypothetical protein
MSRLDSAIRRLQAQRACLDHVCRLIDDPGSFVPGPALEVGLGNGRTYDHLRHRLGARPIYAFDRQVAAHPDCVPEAPFLLLGDFRETLPAAAARIGAPAALIHADIGSGDETASRSLAETIAPALVALLAEGGILASDQPVVHAGLETLALPDAVPPGRYHLYRRRP